MARRIRTIAGPVDARVDVPGSKSIANRALVCAALATGRSELSNVPDGDDTIAMIEGIGRLGAAVGHEGDRVSVDGAGPARQSVELHAALAGTTSRFLTAVAALGTNPITIDGDPPLRRRPFGPLHDALTQIGVTVRPLEAAGQLPVVVSGPPTGGTVGIRGDVSSQYVTALMLIGPYLPGGLRLSLTSALVSRPYVTMTAAVMARFGVDDVAVGDDSILVEPGEYRPTILAIEPDASSASYPLAVAAVVGGRVTVPGLGPDALQGDARFADLLAAMGCRIAYDEGGVTVSRSATEPLRGIDADLSAMSDLVPTVAVVAAFADTPSRIRGVGFIRGKESDRLGDLVRELRRAGADVAETHDGLAIEPSANSLRAARLGTHHDHRLAMAFGVLGSAVAGIDVDEPDVVSKSWPGFWPMLDGLT